MNAFKNHLSLIVALLGILFSLQTFVIVERAIDAYKQNLANNYSLVVVSKKTITEKTFQEKYKLVANVKELAPDNVIKKLNSGINKKNIELLKLALPKFYRLQLSHYPSPSEINSLTKSLLRNNDIMKVETFAKSHNSTYKLLLLFKSVITVFAVSVGIITVLLISKELKIWQFKHTERMSIMGLFGAPTWLSSAVLFRLAIVDALIASGLAFILFMYLASSDWVVGELASVGISIEIFDTFSDFSVMLGVALLVSLLLASFIVISHKEEV